ncbi:MAG: DNA replication/repair protein RecF [Candidatus Faecousia sp.]|nr:DNA replication/repair protein RecF [Candidatus Faecousia sp.]
MRIEALHLTGFRNYRAFYSEFSPSVNLICGDNAQGKTNLLESICYLSQTHSFRTRKELELVRFGADYADMEAKIFSDGREQILRAVLFSGKRPRQLFLNGVKQKNAQSLKGVLTTVLFCPEDLLVLKKGAAERRRMIDAALCQLRPRYDRAVEEYTRLYNQKSAILRDHFERPDLMEVLPEFNERMAVAGALIVSGRAKYLRELERYASQFHSRFSGGTEELRIEYRTVSTIDDPYAPTKRLYEQIREHQQLHARAEAESGQCLSGPHKDDFEVFLGDRSIKAYGSQGQTRTAAISMKLAEREIFHADTGEMPVLLLDDVLSELDAGRQDFVLNQIKTGQVFITCCDKTRLTELGQTLMIEDGVLLGGGQAEGGV